MKPIVGTFVLTLLFLMPYFYAHDPYFISGFALALLLGFCLKGGWSHVHWNGVDIGVLLFLVYDGISFCFTSNWAGCTGQLRMTFLCVIYYMILRLWGDRPERWRALLGSYAVCIGLFSLLALSYFFLFQKTVRELGFPNLYDFRFLLSPLGVVNNEWASLQLLFGGVIAMAWYFCRGRMIRYFLLITGMLVWLQALWSFSRGIYVSLFLLLTALLVLQWRQLRNRGMIKAIILFAGISGIVFITSRQDVLRTLRMTETVSQQRSIDTRLNTWNVTETIIKMYPYGVGNGNYQIVADRYATDEKGNEMYASYAMNVLSQLVVEKGWIGLALYGGTFLLLTVTVIRKKKRIAWLAWIFLLVFLVREQTFSAFFLSLRVQWLFFTLLAIAQLAGHMYKPKEDLKANRLFAYSLSMIPIGIWLFCLWALLLWKEKETENQAFLTAVKNKDYQKAEQEAKSFDGYAPLLLNRALWNWNRSAIANNENARRQVKLDINEAKRLMPYDIQIEFYSKWSSSENLEPLAKTYPQKLEFAWAVYEQAKEQAEREKSCQWLTRCVMLNPRILDTDYWKNLSQIDSGMVRDVSIKLEIQIRGRQQENPIGLAKMGSIALKLGELDLAETCLSEALHLLPNLSMAWFNLGVVKERKKDLETAQLYKKRGIVLGTCMIIPGDEWKHYLHTGPVEIDKDIYRLVNVGYQFRFRAWYGCQLLKSSAEP